MSPALIAYNGYDSGLGNRVRVVLGAQSLATLEGRSFAYVWPTGKLFGPRFSELWSYRAPVIPRALSRGLARLYPYVDEQVPSWLDEAKRGERLWQIRTGSPLVLPPEAQPWEEAFRRLLPSPAIADRIDAFYDEHLRGRPYVGVMIRAHAVSHAKTRQASPVEWFIARLQELYRADPSTTFFLSCDRADVQEQVMAAVPGCVAQADKGGYNTTAGVLSSIVDLYLLASSGYLIGPHWSSFIHLAEHLAGDRLRLETALDALRGPVDYLSAGLVDDPLRPALRYPTLRYPTHARRRAAAPEPAEGGRS